MWEGRLGPWCAAHWSWRKAVEVRGRVYGWGEDSRAVIVDARMPIAWVGAGG